jgi:hypothetical protein
MNRADVEVCGLACSSFSPDDCMKIINGDARRLNGTGLSQVTCPVMEFIAPNYTCTCTSIIPLIWYNFTIFILIYHHTPIDLISITPWRRIGKWMYRSTFSSPLHWLEVSGPSAHLGGGWVGLRDGLDCTEKWKFLNLKGHELRFLGRPAGGQSLYLHRHSLSLFIGFEALTARVWRSSLLMFYTS